MQTERLLNKRAQSKSLDKHRHPQGIPCEQRSLFADLFVDPSSPAQLSPEVTSAAGVQRLGADSLDHLAAAQMLAKKLRNRPRRARGRKRTGIAICQHLIALLREGEQISEGGQVREGSQTEQERPS